ncbi:hypothetical protein F4861DRAFT_162277 [Xylaria intraflava]|nr:hypothetical protein F4861DRAFT_162277 [Xylaria intraflava]
MHISSTSIWLSVSIVSTPRRFHGSQRHWISSFDSMTPSEDRLLCLISLVLPTMAQNEGLPAQCLEIVGSSVHSGTVWSLVLGPSALPAYLLACLPYTCSACFACFACFCLLCLLCLLGLQLTHKALGALYSTHEEVLASRCPDVVSRLQGSSLKPFPLLPLSRPRRSWELHSTRGYLVRLVSASFRRFAAPSCVINPPGYMYLSSVRASR